ncbi:MAG: NUDIX hydrolase [Proteobacteria bacterium]|nr:NUDIX hydrolase [Pseudomonadota bacterium]
MPVPVVGVAGVVWDGAGRFLLIRRTKEPRLGQWSLPGGKVEFGESLEAAVLREVLEETSLTCQIVGLIGVAETIRDAGAGAADSHFVLIDYTLRVLSGDATAGSDAADPTWFDYAELSKIPMWEEMRRIIEKSAREHVKPI